MALFSKQSNTEPEATEPAVENQATVTTTGSAVALDHKATSALVIPRLSEKAGAANRLNKYIFTIFGKLNKVELRKMVEKSYGVKIANVNIMNVAGKSRRYGRTIGKTSGFKKAIVTLAPGSKKIDIVEPT